QHLAGGGLAGSVRADQGVNRPRGQIQVEPAQGHDSTVGDIDTGESVAHTATALRPDGARAERKRRTASPNTTSPRRASRPIGSTRASSGASFSITPRATWLK